jgi:PAS domain S-box-containing protein/diguanylate cyclase (GGDEF)-like protein
MELAIDMRPKSAVDRHALEQIVTRVSEAVVLIDAQDACMPIVFVNPAFEKLTGYTADEVVGTPWRLLDRDRDKEPELERLRAAVSRAETVEVGLPDVRKDGSVWPSRVSFSPVLGPEGEARYLLFLQRESREAVAEAVPEAVSEAAPEAVPDRGAAETGTLRREVGRELGRGRPKFEPTGRTDAATGLLRYEHFVDVLNRDLAIAQRDRRPVSVMLFEIVEFDVYRETFGDKAAESCLRMVAAQIGGTLRRAGDLCSRWSDCVLVASVLGQEPAQARELADRITRNVLGLKLHNPRAQSGRYVTVTSAVRGGVPKPEEDAEEFVTQTERSLNVRGWPARLESARD